MVLSSFSAAEMRWPHLIKTIGRILEKKEYSDEYNLSPTRSCYGSAAYVNNHFHCTEIRPRFNLNGVEITMFIDQSLIPNLHVIGIHIPDIPALPSSAHW